MGAARVLGCDRLVPSGPAGLGAAFTETGFTMLHYRLLFLAAVACGCGDDDEESQLCQDLRAKITECNLDIDTSRGCNASPSEDVECAARCLVEAQCTDIVGPPSANPYYQCNAACVGASPDDFVCADGSGFLPQAGVCDGQLQCPDGSDEANCSG